MPLPNETPVKTAIDAGGATGATNQTVDALPTHKQGADEFTINNPTPGLAHQPCPVPMVDASNAQAPKSAHGLAMPNGTVAVLPAGD